MKSYPQIPGVTHRQIAVGDISLHVAEAGTGPLVILLHGFPELWFSWRHQLPALAAAGYHAVAPDLRGYGESDVPTAVNTYRMTALVADVVGLLDTLDSHDAILVGHDWGGRLAWQTAQAHPDRVRAVVLLGPPPPPREPVQPSATIARFARGAFNFALAFQGPDAEKEFEADPRSSLRRFYFALSGDAPLDLVPWLFTEKKAGSPILEGMPDPDPLPGWLSSSDLDVYASAFATSGFRGAFNRYRNLDADWQDGAGSVGPVFDRPVLYIGGDRDPAVRLGNLSSLTAFAPGIVRAVLLPGCGHWTQQERPSAVTREVLAFLDELRGDR
jgi:pimeloyl-ACP methyl ester carboxylesterase